MSFENRKLIQLLNMKQDIKCVDAKESIELIKKIETKIPDLKNKVDAKTSQEFLVFRQNIQDREAPCDACGEYGKIKNVHTNHLKFCSYNCEKLLIPDRSTS